MYSEINDFRFEKKKHDEHEDHGQEGASSQEHWMTTGQLGMIQQNSTPVPASGLVSITECFEVNQVVEAILIHCVHHGYLCE